MLEAKLLQAAKALLKSTIDIAPPDTRDWGQAMMAEVNHAGGSWGGTLWALGSSGVLARRALVSLLTLGGSETTAGSGGCTQETVIGKTAVKAAIGCVVAVLLLCMTPAFREGLQLAMAPWHWVLKLSPPDEQARLRGLAQRAEAQHDAEGLAFCAIWIDDNTESARLVEEAARLDPSLIWVYAIVALHHPRMPVISQWVARLERWDPQNALYPMITAENTAFLHDQQNDEYYGLWRDPARVQAMDTAFHSTEFDDYSDRLVAMECAVASRYGLYNPEQIELAGDHSIPFVDVRHYAQSLVETGKTMEARGDKPAALEKYWLVARFGEMIDSQGHTFWEHFNGARLRRVAYQQLQALAEREGNQVEAAHFAYLVTVLDPSRLTAEGERQEPWPETAWWNALEVTVSGLLLPIFVVCLAVAAFMTFVRRGTHPRDIRSRRLAARLMAGGAAGLLLSSLMLYLAFRPYANTLDWLFDRNEPARTAEMLSRLPGDQRVGLQGKALSQILSLRGRRAADLTTFLYFNQQLPFSPFRRGLSRQHTLHAVHDIWAGVVALGLVALGLIGIRQLRRPTRIRAPI